ncbi:MAG: methylated-DNA--[protein]-cysteine S-methyltransferase [Bacteroidales bacterium]|nr:methylated-DNA--[protein]-cysteine S-methyltransferase [Bacteroidales bacterium]MDD4603237.1 methylated-DNA--[protein]-cysteine S-methyltransferase [Bacteroidales bacterium]
MNHIQRAFLKTPIGFLEITGSEQGIQSLNFLNFRVRIHRVPSNLKSCIEQLEEYFEGSRQAFSMTLDLEGSPFRLKVWQELLKIPYGTTISYLELARRIGNIKALRAVGGANRNNPVSILIPCHRVVGFNGKLVGYAGGLWRKKWLLEHEHAFAQRDLFYERV